LTSAAEPATQVPTVIPFVDSPAAGRRDYLTGNYEEALRQFRAQIASEPMNAEPYSNAGQVLVRLGQTREALPLLSKAVDLDPARWAYRFNLARAEGLMGQWDKAAQDYAEASKLFPSDYATLFNLGQALHRAGREDEAVAQYRQAIQLKPEDASFYLALATSEEKLGHAPEAAAAYRRYVSMEPASRHATAITARADQLAQVSASNGQPSAGTEQVRQ
jgi:tetratricopeptide (TPR) repeat protein